jgi:hypothetical protein
MPFERSYHRQHRHAQNPMARYNLLWSTHARTSNTDHAAAQLRRAPAPQQRRPPCVCPADVGAGRGRRAAQRCCVESRAIAVAPPARVDRTRAVSEERAGACRGHSLRVSRRRTAVATDTALRALRCGRCARLTGSAVGCELRSLTAHRHGRGGGRWRAVRCLAVYFAARGGRTTARARGCRARRQTARPAPVCPAGWGGR